VQALDLLNKKSVMGFSHHAKRITVAETISIL
jgi:hypothetical protein